MCVEEMSLVLQRSPLFQKVIFLFVQWIVSLVNPKYLYKEQSKHVCCLICLWSCSPTWMQVLQEMQISPKWESWCDRFMHAYSLEHQKGSHFVNSCIWMFMIYFRCLWRHRDFSLMTNTNHLFLNDCIHCSSFRDFNTRYR